MIPNLLKIMRCEYLSDHFELISEIAQLKLEEYGQGSSEITLESLREDMKRELYKGKIPAAYVIVEEGKFLGVYSPARA